MVLQAVKDVKDYKVGLSYLLHIMFDILKETPKHQVFNGTSSIFLPLVLDKISVKK